MSLYNLDYSNVFCPKCKQNDKVVAIQLHTSPSQPQPIIYIIKCIRCWKDFIYNKPLYQFYPRKECPHCGGELPIDGH